MTVKSKLFLVVTGVALSLLSSARSHAAEILVNAINSGKVRATFRGRGSSSGDSMIVTVAKTNRAGRGPLVLSVPAGTRLNSASASVQNMVIAGVRGRMIDSHRFQPATEIELASTAPVSFLLEAYCAEFEKDNPSSSSGFSAGGWDKTLAAVLKEAKRRGLSPAATQAAVWIVTDDISLDALQEKFSVSQAEWNQARAVVERTRKGASSRAMIPASLKGDAGFSGGCGDLPG